MRKYIAALFGAVVSLSALTVLTAQTPTFKLSWDQPEGVAAAQSYIYTLKVDAAAAVTVVQTCAAAPAPSTAARCTAPLPTLASGQHTLTLTAFNGFGATSSDPLAGGPPQKPVSISVTVTITIP